VSEPYLKATQLYTGLTILYLAGDRAWSKMYSGFLMAMISRPNTQAFFQLVLLSAALAAAGLAQENPQTTATAATAKAVGTIKAISGNNLTVTSDAGTPMNITVQDSTRMVRTEPGAKDLKGATAITLPDLQSGDRVLVRGRMGDDGKSLVASSVIVIKGGDVAAKQQREREDWQKRGTGGLVTAVDPTAGTITISNSTMGGTKTTIVRVSRDTMVRRYAPDSVRFDDATPGTIDQIKVGDQLRARGTRSADGSELAAEEIVSGTFRNIAGMVISADAANNSLSVQDLSTKKPVTLRINPDSQLRSLPPMVAQRIAARLKGGAEQSGSNPGAAGQPAQARSGETPAANGGSAKPGGDFQQMLKRMPPVSLADLQKGDGGNDRCH
jgi:hypothetical protein